MKKRCWLLLICLLLTALCCTAYAEGEAVLSLSADNNSGYGGDEITLTLHLDADNVGGLQTNLCWNTGYLTYVEGSAAFSQDFADSAMVHMVNADKDGTIRLVYGNTSGYTAENEAIFTARFLLTDDVAGETVFTLSNAKVTDATADLAAMTVTTSSLHVQTNLFDPGSVYFYLGVDEGYPQLGSTITVALYSSTSETLGSLQGVLRYDPAVLEYVADSAAFTDAYTSAGMTTLFHAETPGEISFVYASTTGCNGYEVATMQFKVIGGLNEYASLQLADMKATNASANHLALMDVSYSGNGLWPQPVRYVVYYTAYFQESEAKCGDTITLAIRADGEPLGGAQGVITYDASKLTYVSGSAAFTDAFAQNATVNLINDGTEGKIQFVYANAEGYTPDGSDILTARFVVGKANLDYVRLTGLKTTTSDSLKTLTSEVVLGGMPYVWHVEATRNSNPATCTEPGLSDEIYCSVCDEVIVASQEISATGHWEMWDSYIGPTCTASGWTEGSYCYYCGEVFVEKTEIPATGHSEYYVGSYDAFCTYPGYTDLVSCMTCGEAISYTEMFPALGHVEIYQSEIPAGCGWEGFTDVYSCERCGEIFSYSGMIPATGEHVEWSQEGIPATCISSGWTAGAYCSMCGQTLYGMEEIPATGHTEVYVDVIEPTCTVFGYTQVQYCTTCGEIFSYAEELPMAAHTETLIPGNAATCITEGLTDGSTCGVCGETLIAQEIIPATGHSEVWNMGYAATCTTDGLTDGSTCGVCGETLIAQEIIPATGHSEVWNIGYAATCTTDGLTDSSTCGVCGEMLIAQEIIPATGHCEVLQMGYPATCTTDGLTDGLYCTVCGETTVLQENIPATGHVEVTLPEVPATHVTTGLTEGLYCDICGTVLTPQQETPMVQVVVITLPEQLQTIAEEAFEGCPFACVVVPQTCQRIEARAFAACGDLQFIEIPESVTFIDAAAFIECSDDLIIVTTADSPAHTFAQMEGIRCVLIPGK